MYTIVLFGKGTDEQVFFDVSEEEFSESHFFKILKFLSKKGVGIYICSDSEED